MITHNGTYLVAATHHGMPIVAATMGGKMVIGGKWLPSATLQAIVAAFGSAEGTEVIAKTNDYINRIATTDPQRALLLAGFINEDPLLVCSLVETSKMRWLVGDGKAWIDTGVVGSIDLDVNMIVVHHYVSNSVLGAINTKSKGANRIAIEHYEQGPSFAVRFGNKGWINGGKIENDTEYDIVLNKDLFSANGNETSIGATTYSDTSNIIFPSNEFSVNDEGTFIKYRKVVINGTTPLREMYPFIRNGEAGMLDIISGTFHTNANTSGSFTITLTDTTPA